MSKVRRRLASIVVASLFVGLAASAHAEDDAAPNAHFLFGSDIFEEGQSQNIGPAAQLVLDEGM